MYNVPTIEVCRGVVHAMFLIAILREVINIMSKEQVALAGAQMQRTEGGRPVNGAKPKAKSPIKAEQRKPVLDRWAERWGKFAVNLIED